MSGLLNAAGLKGPTLAGFVTFIQTVMQVPATAIPSPATDPNVALCYNIAVDLVNSAIAQVSGDMYILAVNNLAASNLVNYYPDPIGAPNVAGSSPAAPFFANLRNMWKLNSFVAGVVNSSSDEGTSQSLEMPEWASKLSIADLQYLKDPYGRHYMQIAQRFGSLWGLS